MILALVNFLTAKAIEEQIESYKLSFLQIRNERIEWGMDFPMFVDTFHTILEKNNLIPSQDVFVERYFKDNSEDLTEVLESHELKIGLEARLRRTYPSLVRDAHFDALLREKGLDVVYDRNTDVEKGVDHTVVYKDHVFYVHCFVSTAAGKYGRRLKNKRHSFRGEHIDLPLELGDNTAKKVGDFYLYNQQHVDCLIQIMENSVKQSNLS